ncbi:MurR/RpiR family transcriptional regulator [Vibrio aestuarianus]|uniref:MurR/RpiR family transcriptional regulator n=1 Tax=Vibrio aestuarianus TaxID=28171 RepID=UPI00237CA08A|nr:MurR/RpiR family transcriptional regulator [Vibrio aestuarianus]
MGLNLQIKLSSMKPQLSSGHSKLCDYIIENFEHVSNYSGAELAKSAGVSISTLHRFIKLLDFESFTAFKFAMKSDINSGNVIKKQVTSDPAVRVLNNITQAAKLAHQSLDRTLLNEVAKYISSSERIYILQTGEDNFILDYLERKLRCLDKSVLVVPKISFDVNVLEHKDLIVSIEQNGDEEVVVSLLTKSYLTNAMLVRFSNAVNTKIQKLSDIDIHIPIIETDNNEVRSERYVGHIMVIDILLDLVVSI